MVESKRRRRLSHRSCRDWFPTSSWMRATLASTLREVLSRSNLLVFRSLFECLDQYKCTKGGSSSARKQISLSNFSHLKHAWVPYALRSSLYLYLEYANESARMQMLRADAHYAFSQTTGKDLRRKRERKQGPRMDSQSKWAHAFIEQINSEWRGGKDELSSSDFKISFRKLDGRFSASEQPASGIRI